MKQLKITVNGKPYDVTVEEVGSFSPAAPVAAAPAVPSAPVAAPAPAPVAPAAVAEPASAAPVGSGEGTRVECPMPGTIVDVKVTVGEAVKDGAVLMILEAMKMENEIVAPQNGTITSVGVSKGDSVNSGDLLLTIL